MKLLVVIPLLVAGDSLADGVAAFRAGRFEEARAAFETAAARTSDAATAGLLRYDEALAALRAGDLDAAEAAARAATTRGGDGLRGACDLLLGNVAFERARAAEADARAPGAPSYAFDRAIALCDAARQSWQRAALTREDWPAARRNVERAVAKLAELERERASAQQQEQQGGEGGRPPPPRPLDVPQPAPPVTKPADVAAEHELAPDEVERLFEKLDEQERKKRLLRAARREATAPTGERDW
jgi:hypothetical protein